MLVEHVGTCLDVQLHQYRDNKNYLSGENWIQYLHEILWVLCVTQSELRIFMRLVLFAIYYAGFTGHNILRQRFHIFYRKG